jgi:hypothetical protein
VVGRQFTTSVVPRLAEMRDARPDLKPDATGVETIAGLGLINTRMACELPIRTMPVLTVTVTTT